MRLEELLGRQRDAAERFTFSWDGKEIVAYRGETVLGALIASGNHTLRHTRFSHEPRGMLCGIGVCYECLVTVNGKPNRRACMVAAEPDMVVEPGAPMNVGESEQD